MGELDQLSAFNRHQVDIALGVVGASCKCQKPAVRRNPAGARVPWQFPYGSSRAVLGGHRCEPDRQFRRFGSGDDRLAVRRPIPWVRNFIARTLPDDPSLGGFDVDDFQLTRRSRIRFRRPTQNGQSAAVGRPDGGTGAPVTDRDLSYRLSGSSFFDEQVWPLFESM